MARRRIRLTLDQPLRALYETVGACGDPPQDQSMNFAIFAVILFVLAWVLIPAVLYLIFT